MRKLLQIAILFLSIYAPAVFAQVGTISGVVKSDENQPLQFVNIAVKGTTTGATTGKDGRFELPVPANKDVVILFSYIGYERDSLVVKLKENERKQLVHLLQPVSTQLESIEVKDQQLRTNTFSRLDPKVLTFIPTINASVEDLIKTMPGVSSRNELSSQYSVRGGNYDENLVFVNDIEIYRPFLVRSGQQEGQSFLNPDLVAGISFSSGGFGAKYGDKMSSVLDIKYKKPAEFAGSFDVSLLGASAHLEGTFTKRFSYLLGARYKTNSYLLKGLDTKGNYKPRFFDIQGMLNYEISKKWELSFFGTFTDNVYKLIPETRETSFGTLDEAYKIKIYFDGREADGYQNWLTALTLTFKPTQSVRLKLISSAFKTYEAETYDISGEYWLGKLEVFQGSGQGQITEIMGVGSYLQHARNYLEGTIFNIEHRGNWDKGKSNMLWGAKYQYSFFDYTINEWELQDSAGYSIPRPPDSLGSQHPPKDNLELFNVINNHNTVGTDLISAFIQDTWTFKNELSDISMTAGLRMIYYTFNSDFLVNPRIDISFKPHWKNETVFRLSAGIYSQPPTFREMADLEGNIVQGLKAQTSYQVVAGSDYYFKAWNRPFKFVAEAYYKNIQNLIPYEIDNMKIRYYGTNDAHGYAAGIDFRVNGEFVKGAESWASLSFLKTEEYFQGSWIPRPTDQRMNLAIFFQDFIPKFPTWKMNLTLFYGTGLPFGPPDAPRSEQTLRIPPYRRVDIGLSKQLIGSQTKFSGKNPFRVFDSMWLSLDIFNLLQISNTVSYLWVTDINGRPYAVPNYLTPRMFNLKLTAKF
ncbi:MAG: carboxypeptidase-like regulatory domain-containing protein [Bacteroidetes bacterium]|nr:carboxypeptidase-like regulatory domain-containing protein [Bacteroidota bacterium]